MKLFSKRCDVEIANLIMMMEQNGEQRTIEEYGSIGKSAGFNQIQAHQTESRYTIVEITI